MLDSKAAVAAIGSLKKLPSYSDIEIGLLDKEVREFVQFPSPSLCYISGCSAFEEKVQHIQMKVQKHHIHDIAEQGRLFQKMLLLNF